MRITINDVIQKHTVSHLGYSKYIENFGLWQDSLDAGTYKVTMQYSSSHPVTSSTSNWQTRALTIVYCCPP